MNRSERLTSPCVRLDYSFFSEHTIEGRYRTLDPSLRPPYNMHYEIELGIVVRGTMRCDFRGKTFTLGPGQVWLTGMWEPHRMYALHSPCTGALLLAWPDMAALRSAPNGVMRLGLAPFLVPVTERPQTSKRRHGDLIGLAERIRQALAGPPDVLEVWLKLCLMEALLWVTEDWTPPQESSRVLAKPGEINHALQKVFQSSQFVTTTEGARACGLSRNLFSRRFREIYRMSFADFALRHRLSGAADDILHQDMPIKAVAAKWGFRDVSHFHRAFVRHFACRPGAYRQARAAANAQSKA